MTPLSDAPRHASPLQVRYKPGVGTPSGGAYGRVPVVVYGRLPCALLICEMKGPSALALEEDGTELFRDVDHRGCYIDTDFETGNCIVGAAGYRTLRWLDRAGTVLHTWSLPVAILGEIYGIRACGSRLFVNTTQPSANNYCEMWVFDLDPTTGFPISAGTRFTAYEGVRHYARSMKLVNGVLWIASMVLPLNPQGCQGSIRGYDYATGNLLHEFYGQFPNDVDVLPNGDVVWVDEHLDRARIAKPSTGAVRTLFAGSETRALYEPGVESVSANDTRQKTLDGTGLSATAVEYCDLPALYAPNGISAITPTLYAVADTDNSRVIIVRLTDTWKPEVVAVVAILNEPTKVRIIPPV